MAAVLLVSACNGGSDPVETPTATDSTTVTPTETATPEPSETTPDPTEAVLPPLPDAAKENTPEGAEAFIRYYFEVVNGLYTDPRSGVVPQLSDAGCVSCQRTEATIADLEASSARARTEPFIIRSVASVGGDPSELARFNMVVDAPENATVDSSGNESNPGLATTLTGVGAVSWEGERWVLYDLELTQ